MADFIQNLSLLLIFGGIIVGIIRLVKGPLTVDRVIAMDLLTMIAIAVIVLLAHFANRFIYVDVAIVYALLSFLGVLGVARYLEKGI